MAGLPLVIVLVVVGTTTGWLLAWSLAPPSGLAALCAALVLVAAELVLVVTVLSQFDRLQPAPILASYVVVLVLAGGVWNRLGRPRAVPTRAGLAAWLAALRDPVVAGAGVVASVAYAYAIAVATVPPADSDALTYRLPRAAMWAAQGSVGGIGGLILDARITSAAPASDAGLAVLMVVDGSDRLVGLPQLLGVLALAAGTCQVARAAGLGTREALFGALVLITSPVIFLQAGVPLNDVLAAAPLVLSLALWPIAWRWSALLAGVALGLGVAAKFTGVILLPMLLVVAVVLRRPTPRRAGVALGAAWVVGAPWYLWNLERTGSIDGGWASAFEQTPDHGSGPTLERLGRFTVQLLQIPGVDGADRKTFVIAGLLLAVIGLTVAAIRGRPLLVHVVTAAVGVACLPWLFLWTYLLLGRPLWPDEDTASLTHLFAVSSATSVWFGPAFVVLAVVVVVTLARSGGVLDRRRLVVLVAAPLLGITCLALAVSWDPLRGRFLVAAAALAAATFGVALRHRVASGAAVVVLGTTVLLAMVHFPVAPLGWRLFEPARDARWHISAVDAMGTYARSDREGTDVFRFVRETIPTTDEIAFAVAPDSFIYAMWNPGSGRVVHPVARDGTTSATARWLAIAGEEPAIPDCEGWQVAFEAPGWVVLHRDGSTVCRVDPAALR